MSNCYMLTFGARENKVYTSMETVTNLFSNKTFRAKDFHLS